MITLEQIQKRIAEAIKRSGMTQTAIAAKLQIKQSTVAHYIRGDASPSLETFANLCRVLDVDANDVLCLI